MKVAVIIKNAVTVIIKPTANVFSSVPTLCFMTIMVGKGLTSESVVTLFVYGTSFLPQELF